MNSLIEIDWSGNGLSSTIPSTIGMLHALTALRLGNNKLTGSLPTDFGMLVHNFKCIACIHIYSFVGLMAFKLFVLDLRRNLLSGAIASDITQLTSLEYLDLSDNRFAGYDPSTSLGELSRLTYLNISANLFITHYPTPRPTVPPSSQPTTPTLSPYFQPTNSPTASPSFCPSFAYSANPTGQPSYTPTEAPSLGPSSAIDTESVSTSAHNANPLNLILITAVVASVICAALLAACVWRCHKHTKAIRQRERDRRLIEVDLELEWP
jgi:hypothetical protein